MLGFEYGAKKKVFLSGNVPSSMHDQTFIHCREISNPKSPILFRLANVLPGAKMKRGGEVVLLDTSPPELTDNRGEFVKEFLGEDDGGHIVDRNGSKNRVDIGEPTSMVQFISLEIVQLGFELIDNERVGIISVSMIENERVTKMNGMRSKVFNRKDGLDISFVLAAHVLTEEDSRFAEVGGLPRFITEATENPTEIASLSSISLLEDKEIISKKQRVDLRALVTELNPMNVVTVNGVLKSNG